MSDKMHSLSVWDFYEDTYGECKPSYDNDTERIEFILKNIPEKGAKILDIGCHDGTISKCMKKLGNDVIGIDFSEKALDRAKSKGIKVIHGDVMAEKFDCKFDVIVAGECLEHIFDGDAFLTKIKRLLNPCGKLILTTPNVASFGRRMMMLLGKNPILEYTARKTDAGHIRYFTFENMKALLEDNGFVIDEICGTVVNFCGSGKIRSRLLAKLFPGLSASICVVAS